MGQEVSPAGWQPLGAGSSARAGRRYGAAGGRGTTLPRTANEQAFLRLALTHGLVMAGDAMVTVALAGSIFFSTDVNGARLKVLLSLVLTMAPFAVVAPFLGPAIDRSKGGRRVMVILSAAGRCLLCLYLAREVHDLLLFLPGALALLILSKAHAIAKSALVPATVDSPDDLVKAGSRLAIIAAVAGGVAGAVAAGVLKAFHASTALRLAAVVYGVGAVMAVRTRPAPPATLQPADHVDEALRSRGVSLAAVCMATIRGSSGFLTFAVAFDFKNPHHPAPAWWYGLVIVGALVGGFVGNLVGPALRRVLHEERILVLTLGGLAVVALGAALVHNRLGVTVLAFAVGMADGVGQLAFDAIVQRDGSEGTRARSFARFEATFQLLWVVGALIPVIVGLPTHLILPKRVFSLVIAAAAGGALAYYLTGRWAAAGRGPERPAGRPEGVSGPVGQDRGSADRHDEVTQPVPEIWTAVRGGPPPDPTRMEPRTPPVGTPWRPRPAEADVGGAPGTVAGAPDPRAPDPEASAGPRRNPGRSRRRDR
ncbi:MAG TPA: MFS transporter [Acidimicrobiales bacterium]